MNSIKIHEKQGGAPIKKIKPDDDDDARKREREK